MHYAELLVLVWWLIINVFPDIPECLSVYLFTLLRIQLKSRKSQPHIKCKNISFLMHIFSYKLLVQISAGKFARLIFRGKSWY